MSKKTLQDLKDDLKEVHSSQAIQALEDGKFLGGYDVTQEEVEDLHHSYNEAITMKIIEAIETIMDQGITGIDENYSEQSDIDSWNKALDTIMDRCGVVFDKEQDRLVENHDPDYKV